MGEMSQERPLKTVEESSAEMLRLLQYKDINGQNRLFGGQLMAWIDEIAGLTAMRHSGGAITTAAVDSLKFREAAYLNDIVVLRAKVTYVGRTSLEVRVDTYVEDPKDGKRRLINHAYLTEVHVDDDGKPIPVPYGLKLVSEMDHLEWENAEKRIQNRKERRIEGF